MKTLGVLLPTVVLFACLKGFIALDEKWPIVAFESGSVAQIPCMVRGETKAYFWRKGSAYNMSEHVAANVHGVPDEFANATQGKLTVIEDGTLVIYEISPKDDDTYFCRVVTQTSEHYGGVNVYSQGSLDSFLSINQCPLHSSCKVVLEPSSEHQFTCTASYVPSLVDVRWIDNNGTVIKSSSDKYKNGDGSYNISRIAEIAYSAPTLLTCEAFSPAIRGEFIHVQLETVQEPEDESGNYFVAFLVTLIVAIVIIVTISAVCKRCAPKGQEKGTVEEGTPLQEEFDKKVAELEEKVRAIEKERDTFITNNKAIERERDTVIVNNKAVETEKATLIDKNKALQLDLEISTRKYRAFMFESKNKQKVFLRVKAGGGKSSPLKGDNAGDKLQQWRNVYNFTDIFSQDATQETIFSDIEAADFIQDSVDGGKTCVFAFGGPNSGHTYTMKGFEKMSEIHPTVGLVPRAVHKVFQLVDDLKKKQIEMKVTVSRVKSYQAKSGDALTFIELTNLNQEKNTFYNVQGLNVEMKVYTVSSAEEVLDLLWKEPAKSGREDETETSDILQIYIETLKDSKSISKGSLSMAILSAAEATRLFSGQTAGNRSARPLLEPFLKDDKCNMFIIANIASDISKDTIETLQSVTKMKLERAMSPKAKADK